LGLQFIEANEKFFKQISSRATILKEKGYLYKKLNRNDMALEFFKQARDLEKKALQQDGAAE
ncbi:MAG TPA: hypothetical protein VLL97_14415, partial [Acidobacteriota bacterium]|nr:hypothetical protein [Acidobacteriota bacterium]